MNDSFTLLASLSGIDGGRLNYWIVILLMMTGFYIVIGQRNLIKSVIGLNIFQTSVFLLYITMGKVENGTAPIVQESHQASAHGAAEHGDASHAVAGDALVRHGTSVSPHGDDHAAEHIAEHVSDVIYSNPLPSVLMLTAIVVGIATTAVALSLIVRIRESYGTVEEDEILEMDRQSDIEAVEKLAGAT